MLCRRPSKHRLNVRYCEICLTLENLVNGLLCQHQLIHLDIGGGKKDVWPESSCSEPCRLL